MPASRRPCGEMLSGMPARLARRPCGGILSGMLARLARRSRAQIFSSKEPYVIFCFSLTFANLELPDRVAQAIWRYETRWPNLALRAKKAWSRILEKNRWPKTYKF